MEFRPDTVYNRFDSAVEDFDNHHQRDRANKQDARDDINIQKCSDNNSQNNGYASWRNAASLIQAARTPFHEYPAALMIRVKPVVLLAMKRTFLTIKRQ